MKLVWYCICFIALFLVETEVEANKVCWLDKDCRANGFCFGRDRGTSGVCKCIEEYVLINPRDYKCVKPASALDVQNSCEDSLQCASISSNTQCSNGKCICVKGSRKSGNNCVGNNGSQLHWYPFQILSAIALFLIVYNNK